MATKEGYSTFGPRERVEMRFGRLVNASGLTPDCLTDFGDLMCLATDLHVLNTVSTYRLCWSIECTFSSMKSRGFDLERIGMTRKKRLERLLDLVTLVWMWSLRVGVDGAPHPGQVSWPQGAQCHDRWLGTLSPCPPMGDVSTKSVHGASQIAFSCS